MKKQLLDSAGRLNPPDETVAQEFSRKREALAAQCNQVFSARPDREKLIGPDNLQMAMDNNQNFSKFMASLFTSYQPEVLVETVLWVFTAYRSHGFRTAYWAANLNIWSDAIQSMLSDDAFEAIHPFYDWLIVNIPLFVKLTDNAVLGDGEAPDPASRHH